MTGFFSPFLLVRIGAFVDLTSARVLADSTYINGTRLITLEATFPRFILAEVNTHRMLCLAGDSLLEFDLPGGQGTGKKHRRIFTMSLAEFVDKWQNGAAPRRNKPKSDGTFSYNRQPMRERLQGMHIRQLDETTGLIQTSHVTDCFVSGVKRVYEVRAGKFSVAGSADHRVLTPNGWQTIGELAPGDKIIARHWGKQQEDILDPIRLKKIGGQWRSVWQRQKRVELLDQFGGCTKCGSVDDLHVHHIVPVYIDPSLAFSDNNITLLCGDCHHDAHEIQGWQGGTYLYGDEIEITEIVYRGHEMTYDLAIEGKFANFLANGIVVHNSRNSASSRAIPVEKQIARIMANPFVPQRFPINQKGMSASEYHVPGSREYSQAEYFWLAARNAAVNQVNSMIDMANVHKQIATRLLEPFMFHTAILSGTLPVWAAVFELRDHPDAQPEFQILARALKVAIAESLPRTLGPDDWHLPLGNQPGDEELSLADQIRVAIGRIARVSYLTHDGQRDTDADIALFTRLQESGHLSPFEHVARPNLTWRQQANFHGWVQVRWCIEHDADLPGESNRARDFASELAAQ